jgi:hypothetical protein
VSVTERSVQQTESGELPKFILKYLIKSLQLNIKVFSVVSFMTSIYILHNIDS